jgi:1,2-diacylglycerol 3-beta-glucosyltransferase
MLVDLSIITIPVIVFTSIFYVMWTVLTSVHLLRKDSSVKPYRFNPHTPKVSILLPCRDEEKVIASALEECLKQKYDNFEVIVIAHNCTDRTFEIAKRFERDNVRVLELETEECGKGLGLQYGSRFASGDVVVYFDSDSIIDEDYIKNMVDFMYSGKYDVVQGKIIGSNLNYNKLCFLQHMENRVFLSMFFGGKQKLGLPSGLGGTGVMIRRSTLDKIGGFRNVLVEDFDLCIRTELEGFKIGYCKDAVVKDEKVPKISGLFRQRSRWMAGDLELTRILKPKQLFSLAKKNPVDFLQLLSPFYTLALWLLIGVGAFSFFVNTLRLIPWLSVTSFYTSISVFILETVLLQSLILLLLNKECTSRAEFKRCFINLPLFYLYTLHYLLVFWKALFVKSWQNTKTEHGFR